MDQLDNSAFAMAAVIEVQGFVGATFRGVIAALNIASRAPYPRKAFGTVAEAATWLSQLNRPAPLPAPSAADLTTATAQLRASSNHG